jgi:hypothetical protein
VAAPSQNRLPLGSSRSAAFAAASWDFAPQMGDVFGHLARVLRSGAPMVIVVGDSVIGGRHVDNGRLLIDVAGRHDFSLDVWSERTIRAGRSAFNRAHSRGRKREHVLLLRAASSGRQPVRSMTSASSPGTPFAE